MQNTTMPKVASEYKENYLATSKSMEFKKPENNIA
jgi:hypothetical protein